MKHFLTLHLPLFTEGSVKKTGFTLTSPKFKTCFVIPAITRTIKNSVNTKHLDSTWFAIDLLITDTSATESILKEIIRPFTVSPTSGHLELNTSLMYICTPNYSLEITGLFSMFWFCSNSFTAVFFLPSFKKMFNLKYNNLFLDWTRFLKWMREPTMEKSLNRFYWIKRYFLVGTSFHIIACCFAIVSACPVSQMDVSKSIFSSNCNFSEILLYCTLTIIMSD